MIGRGGATHADTQTPAKASSIELIKITKPLPDSLIYEVMGDMKVVNMITALPTLPPEGLVGVTGCDPLEGLLWVEDDLDDSLRWPDDRLDLLPTPPPAPPTSLPSSDRTGGAASVGGGGRDAGLATSAGDSEGGAGGGPVQKYAPSLFRPWCNVFIKMIHGILDFANKIRPVGSYV